MLITIDNTETFLGSLESYAAERAGVHRTTVQRWHRRGWPPILLRLAALERGGHLGLIHEAWKGWRIEHTTGDLIAPPELAARPFRPADLIAAPILYQLQRELERMRAEPRRVEPATLPPVQLTVI